MKIREVLKRAEAYHPDLGPGYDGCDGVKQGDPDQECTGVVSALVPTVEIIRKTAELGANLLYVHEPTSYLTPDWPEWKADFSCSVYDEKLELIKKHGIVVYRDHDHMHAHRPDSIFTGVLKYTGWLPYLEEGPAKVPFGFVVNLPKPEKLKDINEHLMASIGMRGVRFMGDPEAEFERLAVAGHIYPDAFIPQHFNEDGTWTDYATEIIRTMEKDGIELILPGEVIEWTVLSYIRDANALGKKKACINLGHYNWEELGAKYAADWLGELVKGETKVTYVPTGDAWSFQLH